MTMKIPVIILLFLVPMLVVAQPYPGMSEADMQKIHEMQTCMKNIDHGKLMALEERQKKFDAEMKSLCHSGKRDEAQKKAKLYAKEMMNNPTIQTLKKCSEIGKGIMPEMPFMSENERLTNKHVCDSY